MQNLLKEFYSKYGFILNLVNCTNTTKFPHDLYRVRLVEKNEKIEKIEQLAYPKLGINLGRCNFKDEPMFYCSDKSTTAIAETFKYQNPKNKYLYLSVWNIIPGNNISIFALLEKAKDKGLISLTNPLEKILDSQKRFKAEQQLSEIEKYFYDDEHSKSACMSKLLFNSSIFPCDCIFYPSVLPKECGINISVKPDYFDKHFKFTRGYIFEVTGQDGDYKVFPLKFTLSKTDKLVWSNVNLNELILRTLISKDLDLDAS